MYSRSVFSKDAGKQQGSARWSVPSTPGDLQYCFFTNGGAEAVEMALKLARIATGGRWYISTVGAFHGKSMGAISMGGKSTYRVPYTPMVQQVQHVEYGVAVAGLRPFWQFDRPFAGLQRNLRFSADHGKTL